MKLKGTFDKDVLIRQRQQPVSVDELPVKEGDILSWDKQPKALKEIYGDKGRTYGRVASIDTVDGQRWARLNFLRKGDFQDFDTTPLSARIKAGTVQVEHPKELLTMIADTLPYDARNALMEFIDRWIVDNDVGVPTVADG